MTEDLFHVATRLDKTIKAIRNLRTDINGDYVALYFAKQEVIALLDELEAKYDKHFKEL